MKTDKQTQRVPDYDVQLNNAKKRDAKRPIIMADGLVCVNSEWCDAVVDIDVDMVVDIESLDYNRDRWLYPVTIGVPPVAMRRIESDGAVSPHSYDDAAEWWEGCLLGFEDNDKPEAPDYAFEVRIHNDHDMAYKVVWSWDPDA